MIVKMMITTSFLFSVGVNAADLDSQIKAYENSNRVAVTVRKLRKMKLSKSIGMCAKYVRLGFMESGLIPSHPGIAYAKNYKPYFDRNGWTNLFSPKTSKKWSVKIKDSLFNTPAGCAVVYDAINPKNDKNGFIGHIETRVKNSSNVSTWGFISDYLALNSRAGLKCAKKGPVVKRRRYVKGVTREIYVTTCKSYSKKAAHVSDEWKNRKVIGVHCKL